MLPPILPASLAEMFPLYPSFKVTPTSLGVKNIFRKQSPKIIHILLTFQFIDDKIQTTFW